MTMISCIKRTGEEVKFDFAKIKNAVEKAFAETDDGSENSEYAESIKVIRKLKSKFSEMSGDNELHRIKVEDIQNSIEEALASEQCFKTLTAFVKYREAHEINRNLSDAILDVISQENADIVNDNANIDGKTNVGVREAMSNEVIKNFNLSKILPKKLAKAHKKDIYIHDLGYSFFAPFTNCCLVNIEDMLRDGFKMGSAIIEPPKSLRTASTVITQIMATVSAGQYGGTSVHDVDLLLEPYVMLSFEKYRKQAERMFGDLGDANLRIKRYAEEMTEKEVKDSMQTFEYQLNSLINGHAQSIFCTLGFGMGTSWAARLIQKYILLTRLSGLGKNHETAIFPKLTFFHCEGINKNPEDPNYDIKKLALQCSATRMYPDWLNVPKLTEITGGRKTPMGAVSYDSVVTYKWKGELYVEGIGRLFDRYIGEMKHHGVTDYYDTDDLEVLDIDGKFAKVRRLISNPDQKDWYRLTFSNGRVLECTHDHPLPVITEDGTLRTECQNLKCGDSVKCFSEQFVHETADGNIDDYWFYGLTLCDGCYADSCLRISLGEDETDILDNAKNYLTNHYPDMNVKITSQNRGKKGVYTDIELQGKGITKIGNSFASMFGGLQKIKRHIPNFVFRSNRECRLAFFAGMMDADGHVNKKGKGQIGSTNKELALQQMSLIQSLGIKASIYCNHYSKNTDKVRYYVEFVITHEIGKYMKSNKKIIRISDKFRNSYKPEVCTITKIEFLCETGQRNYDFTTATDTFVVNGIATHNCRSFLGEWHDESGKEQYAGRFNLGVVTVNLPRIGLELTAKTTEERIREFFEKLDKKCELAHSALKLRIKYLSRASASCNPFLWQEGAFAKLKPADKIIEKAKNGYASISLGYIGIHEALNGIFGEDGQIIGNPEKIKIAQDILKFMTEKCKEWKEKEHFAYSLYGTPAETLCKTFLEQDKKDFGVVLGVTDKAYYQNSFHLDVRTQVDPFTKIDFESNFQPFSPGGFITYIESQNLAANLEALEDIVNYAYDKVGYFGINTPADTCDECGFVGESIFSENHYECPECGSKHINVVRRVCGYLGNPASRGFNTGKQAEVNNRVKHFCGCAE